MRRSSDAPSAYPRCLAITSEHCWPKTRAKRSIRSSMVVDTRERIAIAAAGLLCQGGQEPASFTEVLAQSGATRDAIYHHFPDRKFELIREAVMWTGERVRSSPAALPGLTADEVVTAVSRFDPHGRCPSCWRFLVRSGSRWWWRGASATRYSRSPPTQRCSRDRGSADPSHRGGSRVQSCSARSNGARDVTRRYPSPLSRGQQPHTVWGNPGGD